MNRFAARIPSLEPTSEDLFFGRRKFLKSVSASILAAPAVFCTASEATTAERSPLDETFQRADVFPAARAEAFSAPKGIRPELTTREVAATHNNFYEFLPGRGGPVWEHTADFKVSPWKVEVTGECNNKMTLDLDDLFKFDHEERVYHFRCVERWAMNVPWSGFPLKTLIERADPKSSAKFVRFTTANRPNQMPGLKASSWYPWPYQEALRIDEAMNDLAVVVTGVYGKPLLKQHGAPIRIIVPWKYGYKNPKSIVKIEFVSEQPKTFWQIQPHEYGFLSNVNPNIPHPRWSQGRSYWLGSNTWFQTPIFNGYEKYVADLYPDEPKTLQEPLKQGQVAR